MNLSERIRRIREIRGYNQRGVGLLMNVTQQSYSCLELDASNARIGTLQRYCDAVHVSLTYLISDTPINEETLKLFSNVKQINGAWIG